MLMTARKGAISVLAARADRIRVLVTNRDKADQAIAQELRAAKDGEFQGDLPGFLKWCAEEFGWAKANVYLRLDPEQLEKHRAKDKARQSASRRPDLDQDDPTEKDEETEEFKALALEMVSAGFKVLATQNHPDKGGDMKKMQKVNEIRKRLIKLIEEEW